MDFVPSTATPDQGGLGSSRVCSEDLLSCGRSSSIMHVEGRTAASPAPCKGRVTLLGFCPRDCVTHASSVLLNRYLLP